MLDEYRQIAEGLAYHAPRITVVSNLTGARATGRQLCTPEYWVRQVRETVRFLEGVRSLRDAGATSFVEVGPGSVLSGLLSACLPDDPDCAALPLLRANRPEATSVEAALAGLYVRGVGVNWSAAGTGGARRIDLPSYPFQRVRYWPQPAPQAPTESPRGAQDQLWRLLDDPDHIPEFARELEIDDQSQIAELPAALAGWRSRQEARAEAERLRYRVEWQPLTVSAQRPGLSGRWLLVLPGGRPDAGRGVRTGAASGRGRGHRAPGTRRDRTPGTGRTAALGRRRRALAAGVGPRTLPGLAALDCAPAATLTLLQALGDKAVHAPLWCATRGGIAVDGPGPVDPGQAQVWGLGRVAALEHPRRWGGLVDLPERLDARALDDLVTVLSGIGGEDQVAIRPSGPLGRRLGRWAAAAPGDGAPWRPRGTVLITGGTGGLAGHVARRLAARGAAHLVLLSRRGPDAPGAAELATELTRLGARSTISACDVADRAALERALAQLPAGERITAVVHAAGLTSATPLDRLTLDLLAEQTAAKTRGADHLDALFDRPTLDAFVLFSSISATWGSGGQGGYYAANATWTPSPPGGGPWARGHLGGLGSLGG
ncbi:SDR family NAD(P)-dependent oxidoreductase [Streptacidiphilus sp. 4-A2]|nr:SDR family NAD(P)-dependent oxidoreductase [Streptacidiphilus sp. 4-A2]